jgi:hypothetical protein
MEDQNSEKPMEKEPANLETLIRMEWYQRNLKGELYLPRYYLKDIERVNRWGVFTSLNWYSRCFLFNKGNVL